MKTFAASQPADSPPSFEVSWEPFFLNVDSPETSEENIGVRDAACENLRRGGGRQPFHEFKA